MSRNMILQPNCPKDWQWLNAVLSETPTDEIIWIVDSKGNTGKTWFSQWYLHHGINVSKCIVSDRHIPLQQLFEENGSILIFDMGRRGMSEFDQSLAEALKYGHTYHAESTYRSPNRQFEPLPNFKTPHVVVMAYNPPIPGIYIETKFCIVDVTPGKKRGLSEAKFYKDIVEGKRNPLRKKLLDEVKDVIDDGSV